jgi:hypothetical protein
MEFTTPIVTDDALLAIPVVILVYIVLFIIASVELRQRKFKE